MQGKEEHYGGWDEESEADEVELREYFPALAEGEGRFGRVLGDVDQDDEESGETADWEIHVETWKVLAHCMAFDGKVLKRGGGRVGTYTIAK